MADRDNNRPTVTNAEPPPVFNGNTQLYQQHMERLRQQGHIPNYVSLGNRKVTIQMPQPYNVRKEMEAADVYGPPEGWDYRTATTDWQGEKLPYGAKGFTPQGEAWYGGNNSLSEWWNKHVAEYNFIKENGWKSAGTKKEFKAERNDQAAAAINSLLSGDILGAFAGGFEALSTNFDAWGAGAPEGEEMGPGQIASNVLGDILSGSFALLQRSAELVEEQGMSRIQAIEDVAETSTLPQAFGSDENREEKIANVEEWLADVVNPTAASTVTDLWRFSANMGDTIIPLSVFWNSVRYFFAPGTMAEKKEIFDRRVDAGRVLYSSWAEDAVMEQYLDRIKQGDNEYLVQLEVQRPGFEALGQIALDPLNLWQWWSKGKAATKKLNNYVDFGLKAASPENIKNIDRLSGLDDVAKLATEKAIVSQLMTDAEKAGELLDKIPGDEFGILRKFFNEKLGGNRLTAFTDSAKAWHLERTALDRIRGIIGVVGKNPDDVSEVVKAFAMLTSKNADEVAEGWAIATKFMSPGAVASEASLRFSHTIREMMTFDGVYDVSKFSKAVEKITDPIELLAFYEKQMGQATKRIFPTLTDKKKVFDSAMEAVEKGTMKLEDAQKLDVSAAEKAWLGIEGATDNKVVNGIRAFYAQIYMGLSPGYAMRNMFNNVLTTIVDQGIGAYFDDSGRFLSNKRVAEQFDNITRGMGAAMSDIGFSKADVEMATKNWKLNSLKWAEKLEVNAGRRIMLKSYKDTFRKMMPVILDQSRPILEAAGMSTDEIGHLENLINNNWGKVDEAVSIYKKGMGEGYFNLFEGMGWVPDDMKRFLDENNLLEPFKEAIVGKTSQEDVSRAVSELFQSQRNLADETKHTITAPPRADGEIEEIIGTHYQDEFETITRHIKDNGLKSASNMGMEMNRQADFEIEQITHEMLRVATENAGGDAAAIDALMETIPNYAKVKDLTWYDEVHKTWRGVKDNTNRVVELVRRNKISVEDGFRYLGEFPQPGVTNANFGDYIWDIQYRVRSRKYYAPKRDIYRGTNLEIMARLAKEGLVDLNVGGWKQKLDKADDIWKKAQLWDFGVISHGEGRITNLSLGASGFDETMDVYKLGLLNGYGMPTAEGKRFLRVINARLAEEAAETGVEFKKFLRLEDIPYDDAARAIAADRAGDFIGVERAIAETAANEAPFFVQEIPAPMNIRNPSEAHRYDEMRKRMDDAETLLQQLIGDNWGTAQEVTENPNMLSALDEYLAEASKKELDMRSVAGEIATHNRNYALHDYNSKRGFDSMLSMVYPYQYWHSRTYAKWLQRIGTNLGTISAYAKYKEALAQSHAGAPEWWRYQINSKELLGIFPDHPMYFNLEATLNPLNGITGVDFSDPMRRVDMWTATLEDMNRFGPTTHPLISVATALSLQSRGYDDAAARWGGQLFPQSNTIKAVDSLFGDDPVGWEDPFTRIFANGSDPYMDKRIGRALAQMTIDGLITEEQADEIAYQGEGYYYELAKTYAIRERAPGQLSSLFLGAGFRMRSEGDLLTDKMYNDFFYLLQRREDMPPDEWRMAMSAMSQEFPFMDAIMISSKLGEERDMTYAYSVLGRVGPGQSTQLYKDIGLSRELVQLFYSSKGDMSDWSEGDQKSFMSKIVDLGSVLAIPNEYTQREWDIAKNNYATMTTTMEQRFGEDIQDRIDIFYDFYNSGDKSGADLYLENNKDVRDAMDFKNAVIVSDPSLDVYYGSVKKTEDYYKGIVIMQGRKMFGDDITKKEEAYWNSTDKKTYLRDHPELREYWDYKNQQQVFINQAVVRIRATVGSPQYTNIREDAGTGYGAEQVEQAAQVAKDPVSEFTAGDWMQALGEEQFGVILDALRGKTSYDIRKQIGTIADGFGMDADRLIQYVGLAYQRDVLAQP